MNERPLKMEGDARGVADEELEVRDGPIVTDADSAANAAFFDAAAAAATVDAFLGELRLAGAR